MLNNSGGLKCDAGDSNDDDEAPPPTMSAATKDIAKDWLRNVRGQLRAQGGGDPETQAPNISDDDDSSEDDQDRPTVAASQRTIELAKKWLSHIRPEVPSAAPRRGPIQNVSDDDSSSGDNDDAPGLPVSATAARIARSWLSNLPNRRNRTSGAQIRDNISDDDSSGSDQESSRNARNPPQRVSDSSRRILGSWLQMIR